MILKKTVYRSVTFTAEEVREMILDYLTKHNKPVPAQTQSIGVNSMGNALNVSFEKEEEF